jgi:hypothetical protein
MSSYYTAWDRALGLLQKYGNQLETLITHQVSIDQWENTFKELEAERGIKALFIPDHLSDPAMKG